MKRLLLLVLLVASLTTACTSDGEDAVQSCVDTVVEKGGKEADAQVYCEILVAQQQAEEERVAVERQAAQDKATAEAEAAANSGESNSASAERTPSGGSVLPDVTGLDLQSAQDTLQSEGYSHLDSIDDTGRGRRQIIDSNWIVVGMSPNPGEAVSTAYEITLFVVKDDEY